MFIGGIIGLLYVIFGGMEQVGWVNVFNAIFMYVGVFIAILYLNGVIDGGWVSVNEYYINNGEQWKLELFSNGETWRVYIIGTLVAWYVQPDGRRPSPVRFPHLPRTLRPSVVPLCMLFP